MTPILPLLLLGSFAQNLPSPPTGYHWEAVPELSDEFDGPQLDPGKWTPHHPYWKGREPSRFTEANVSLRHGKLELHSTTNVKDLSGVKDPEKDIWVQSACVASKAPFASYGYYETRMKTSRLSMSSSFWFQGKYSEIDVAEQFGDPTNRRWRSQYMLMDTHYSAGNPKPDLHAPAKFRMSSPAADQFHVYGLWWQDKDTVIFFLDGKEVTRVKPAGEFLEPMYLFFDTEVFREAGIPSVRSLNDNRRNVMYVDWVHSWKLINNDK